MNELADIVAKLLADTAMKAAAPQVGDKLRAMTIGVRSESSGFLAEFKQLFAELAEIPQDLSDRLRNQFRRFDSAASNSGAASMWDGLKDAVSTMTGHITTMAAAIFPATKEALQGNAGQQVGAAPNMKPPVVNVTVPTPRIDPIVVPEPDPNSVRFYHGGMDVDPAGGNQRWLTHDFNYAKGYATKNGNDNPVQYVDIAKDHPIIQDAIQSGLAVGFTTLKDQIAAYGHFEAAPDISDRLRPYAVPETNYQPGTVPQAAPSESSPKRPWFEEWMEKHGHRAEPPESTPGEMDTPSPLGSSSEPPRDGEPWWQSYVPKGRPQTTPEGTPADTPREPGLARKALSWLFEGSKDDRRFNRPPPVSRMVERVGSVASPRLGAVAGGVAALGPHAALAAAAVATTAALAVMPKIIKEFGEHIVEVNRELANYNADIANAFAQFDQAAFFRKMDLAEGTSGSAAFATNEWTKTLDALQGEIKALGTLFNLWSTGVAIIARQLPTLVQILTMGQFDPKLLEKMQKDIEQMAKVNQPKFDWGDKLTRALTAPQLPGQNHPKAPLPPVGAKP